MKIVIHSYYVQVLFHLETFFVWNQVNASLSVLHNFLTASLKIGIAPNSPQLRFGYNMESACLIEFSNLSKNPF